MRESLEVNTEFFHIYFIFKVSPHCASLVRPDRGERFPASWFRSGPRMKTQIRSSKRRSIDTMVSWTRFLVETIATRVEGIASRLEAIAINKKLYLLLYPGSSMWCIVVHDKRRFNRSRV